MLENDRRENERLKQIEQRRLEAERIQHEIEENRRREELVNQVSSWRRAADIRSFLSLCEAEISDQTLSDLEAPFTKWLRWAHQHADRLDPTRNGYLEELLPH
ncbi:MAG: hypothetical protein IPK01_00850 [Acidobacteria bacterium]|nr:hypothetical protein [Acidobacteriota bacterium]